MTRRKVKVGKTRAAGIGSDGNAYGVTQITSRGEGPPSYRRRPCATCPWRLDAPVGRFPAQAYRESAPTAYDAAMTMFSCHESGSDAPATCAGFLLRNAANNIGARIAALQGLDLSKVSSGGLRLYASYRAMAVANGVSPDDPVLAPCRADGE